MDHFHPFPIATLSLLEGTPSRLLAPAISESFPAELHVPGRSGNAPLPGDSRGGRVQGRLGGCFGAGFLVRTGSQAPKGDQWKPMALQGGMIRDPLLDHHLPHVFFMCQMGNTLPIEKDTPGFLRGLKGIREANMSTLEALCQLYMVVYQWSGYKSYKW